MRSQPPTRCAAVWLVRYSTRITELSTPQRISRNSAKSWESPSQWARSARVLTTHWPNHSTQPSNAKSSKTTAAGPMRTPAAARSSDGCPATTPKEGTHTAVISAPPPTKGTRHPLRCPKPHNHKSRVHYPGSRPGDCRAYAHRTCRGCAHSRRLGARRSGRCGIPLGSRNSVHLKGFRETLQKVGSHPVNGRGRHEC